MNQFEIEIAISKQKKFFATGSTLSVNLRKKYLKKLLNVIEKNEELIADALNLDLAKSYQESYMCEIALVKSEIRHMLHHIKKYSKERFVHTPIAQIFALSFVKPVPYGCVLIISPWNYPFLLSINPLIDAISAGNTAIIKPSEYSPATSNVIEKIIMQTFPEEYVKVIQGDIETSKKILEHNFDYIFFTGSKNVGKEIMHYAANNLTPITLELGGKSPCIVDETANLKLSAKRIVFGKLINCGQTCVAPDYIYCNKKIKDKLIAELKIQIQKQYSTYPLKNNSYGKIINQKHFERIIGLMDKNKIIYGGEIDSANLKIAPTIMDNVTWDDLIMQQEIFGPILPIICFDNIQEASEKINSMDSPLALYIFSSDKKNINFIKERVHYGGGCINDTLIHLATNFMGFGGVGASGMGSYHGKCGFETFSHKKSIVDKKTFFDLPMRYQPYSKFYQKLIRLFVR